MEWNCYYCNKGMVTELPSACPECKAPLSKEFDSMTTQEKTAAFLKKIGAPANIGIFTLAS